MHELPKYLFQDFLKILKHLLQNLNQLNFEEIDLEYNNTI